MSAYNEEARRQTLIRSMGLALAGIGHCPNCGREQEVFSRHRATPGAAPEYCLECWGAEPGGSISHLIHDQAAVIDTLQRQMITHETIQLGLQGAPHGNKLSSIVQTSGRKWPTCEPLLLPRYTIWETLKQNARCAIGCSSTLLCTACPLKRCQQSSGAVWTSNARRCARPQRCRRVGRTICSLH